MRHARTNQDDLLREVVKPVVLMVQHEQFFFTGYCSQRAENEARRHVVYQSVAKILGVPNITSLGPEMCSAVKREARTKISNVYTP